MAIVKQIISAIVGPLIILLLLFVMWTNTGVLRFLDITGLSTFLTRRLIKRRFGTINLGTPTSPEHLAQILSAFKSPNTSPLKGEPRALGISGKTGVQVELTPPAEAGSVFPPSPNLAKRALYVEGSHFEMGALIGALCPAQTRRMSVEFVNNVVFDFVGIGGQHSFLGGIIADFVYLISRHSDTLVPDELSAEIFGLWQGCYAVNPDAPIALRRLFVLNYGIDVLLSWIYGGAEVLLNLIGLDTKKFRTPVGCNGFSAFGSAAQGNQAPSGGFWFGRDFMFPTCGPVFGDCAAHIVYNGDGFISPRHRDRARRGKASTRLRKLFFEAPSHGGRSSNKQLVFGAPGMVGAIACMNEHQVAMGVDMVNGRNCNWRRIGLNSLMMIRFANQYSRTADRTIRLMARLPRGVSWLYLVADAQTNRTYAVEAGRNSRKTNYLQYVPKELKSPQGKNPALLPDEDFIAGNPSTKDWGGLMARSNDWDTPPAWFDFNRGLFEHYGLDWNTSKDNFGPLGMLCSSPSDPSIPACYYFAPERENNPEILVAGNQFLIPEMRLLGMSDWLVEVASVQHYADFQWRYDTLNRQIAQALAKGPLGHQQAKDVINFLRPWNDDGTRGEFHFYNGYRKNADGTQTELKPTEIRVYGSTSLFNLRSLSVQTLYDHYCDPWVAISLEGFLPIV